MEPIYFGDIHLGEIAKTNILDCLTKNRVTMGTKVKQVEIEWSKLFNYPPYSVFMNNGTSAVMACCLSLYERGAKQGQNIICPAISFISSFTAIRAAGFVPVPIDIKLETMNINEELVADSINENTKAILGINLLGRPSKLNILQDIAKRHNLLFIVDNCESYGSKYKNKYTLDYCDVETMSTYAAHIAFSGEGGFTCTKDKELDYILRSIRNHGRKPDSDYFEHPIYGLNFKNTDIHASILLESINSFWDNFNIRHKHLMYMINELKNNGIDDVAYIVEQDESNINAPHAISLIVKQPSTLPKLKKLLNENLIEFKRNFGSINSHRCFDYLDYKSNSFPNAKFAGENGIHIGIHRYLSDGDISRMVDTITQWIKSC